MENHDFDVKEHETLGAGYRSVSVRTFIKDFEFHMVNEHGITVATKELTISYPDIIQTHKPIPQCFKYQFRILNIQDEEKAALLKLKWL